MLHKLIAKLDAIRCTFWQNNMHHSFVKTFLGTTTRVQIDIDSLDGPNGTASKVVVIMHHLLCLQSTEGDVNHLKYYE